METEMIRNELIARVHEGRYDHALHWELYQIAADNDTMSWNDIEAYYDRAENARAMALQAEHVLQTDYGCYPAGPFLSYEQACVIGARRGG